MAGNNIVTVNVYQQIASSPPNLQQTGALISLGGSTYTTNSLNYLTQLSDLTAHLGTGAAANELLAMATTWFAQGNTVGVNVLELGASAVPSALTTWITNNPYTVYAFLCPKEWDTAETLGVASVTIGTPGTGYTAAPTVTFSAAPSGGTTATGTATISGGAVTGVTITNPGHGYTATPTVTFSAPGTGTTATGTVVTSNDFVAFLNQYTSLTAEVYFFVTTTGSTYTQYTGTLKSLFALIQAPAAPTTEFSCAAAMYKFVGYAPSAVNRMTPMAFSYLYGVTAYPTTGNSALFTTLKAANVNWVGTGAEGGISNTILFWGTTFDGNDASYWYDVDWVVINSHQTLAACVINGSNNPQAPLYYNQPGVNTLRSVEQTLMNSAMTFGIALPPVTVTAVPFYTFVLQNPNDYAAGIYTGLAVTFTPQGGFKQITFNVTVSQFVAQPSAST